MGLVSRGPATPTYYRIPTVPPGYTRLLVTIIDTDGHAVGSVLVQDLTRPDEILYNEPVTGETSLEGAIYLGASVGHHHRPPEGRVNPPQIALVHRFTEDVAGGAATDLAEIQALVEAYERAQDVFVRGFVAMTGGYDSLAVNAGVREFAQAYAEARHVGTSAVAAHEVFVDSAVSVYTERAGTPRQVSTAWSAFAILHDDELAGTTTLTRLQSAQNLLHVSVSARKALVADVLDGTAGKSEMIGALDFILAAGMAATEMQDFVDGVAAAVRGGADVLEAARGTDLGEEFQTADISAHIDTSQSTADIAASLPDHFSGVENAVGDPDLAALLIALMGGPGYGGE